jgi:hypothetical protein
MSYVFVKMIPMSLAIETNKAATAASSSSSSDVLRAKLEPDLVPTTLEDEDDYSEEDADYPSFNLTGELFSLFFSSMIGVCRGTYTQHM